MASDEQLPVISSDEITLVTDWLYGREKMQRRPEGTAKILLLAVKLHRKRLPWPTRPAISEHLGVSMPLIDVAISQKRASGMLTVVIETVRGRVKTRPSVITKRYIEPSKEVIQNVERAEREARRARNAGAAAGG